jgi:hypothetical protein
VLFLFNPSFGKKFPKNKKRKLRRFRRYARTAAGEEVEWVGPIDGNNAVEAIRGWSVEWPEHRCSLTASGSVPAGGRRQEEKRTVLYERGDDHIS